MKTLRRIKKVEAPYTWEEKSGLLNFLSLIPGEVDKFNENFEFGIRHIVTPPSDIDGDTEVPLKVGFVLSRDNPLLPEITYCLYSMLRDKVLYGYIGIYKEGSIKTLKELAPLKDFKKGELILYDWLRQLVRASCEKIIM